MSQFIEMFDFHELNFNSPSKDFESICLDDTSSATKIPAAEYLQEGKYAVYDQAQEKDIAGYSNTEQGLCRNYPAVLFGDHSRVVKYINEPFFLGADGVKIIRPRKDNLIPEFLYYDLKYHNIPNTGYNRHFKYIKMISLTKASLEEQSQFLSIAHQADKSGFDGRKSQFIEMFGSVDDNPKSYDIKKVGDFAECFAGATPSTKISSYWDNGNIPWMSSGEVHKARVQDTDAKITQQGYDGCSTKMVPIHSIVIALAGQGKTRGTVAINDIELCTNQSLCAIVPNEEVNYEYLFHNLRGRYKELRSMSGDVDGRGGLNLKHIQSIKVIVPPMSEQMKFVSIARQADKSGSGGRESVALMGKVKKSLINYYNI